jgi:hypothetical protein
VRQIHNTFSRKSEKNVCAHKNMIELDTTELEDEFFPEKEEGEEKPSSLEKLEEEKEQQEGEREQANGGSANSHSNPGGPSAPRLVHPWSLLSLYRRWNWHREQLRHEKAHWTASLDRLAVLRRMDEKLAHHEKQEVAEVSLAQVFMNAVRDVWSSAGEEALGAGDDDILGGSIEEVMKLWGQESEVSTREAVCLLFAGGSFQESPEGACSWAELDDALRMQFAMLLKTPSKPSYLRTLLMAFLECVLRVPPFAMSPAGRDTMCLAGLTLSRHPLGSPSAAFVLTFRDLFYSSAQQAAAALNLVSAPECMRELEGPAMSWREPLTVWLRRAVALASQFAVCVQSSLLNRWSCLRESDIGAGLAMEAAVGAVTAQLPELMLMFMANNVRLDHALVERASSMEKQAASGCTMMEALGVPKRLRLHYRAGEIDDFLTGDGDIRGKDRLSEASYEPVIAAMETMLGCNDPITKADAIVSSVRAVVSCVEVFYRRLREKSTYCEPTPSISADDLLPILSFALVRGYIQTRLSNIRAHLDYVENFLPPHLKIGEHGYSLAMLQSAAMALNSDGGKQQARLRQERAERQELQISAAREQGEELSISDLFSLPSSEIDQDELLAFVST